MWGKAKVHAVKSQMPEARLCEIRINRKLSVLHFELTHPKLLQLNLFTFYIAVLIHICFFRKTTSVRSYSTSSVLSYHSRVGEGYFWKSKENTNCRIFFTRLCALSENNLDYSAVFALVFAIDSYPALTSLVRWQNKNSIDRRLMVIDSQQLFPKETPEEKWKLWHFTFYCKVDAKKKSKI